MKKYCLICLLLILIMTLTVCCKQASPKNNNAVSSSTTEDTAGEITAGEQELSTDENKPIPEERAAQEKKLILSVDGKTLDVSWEQNETVAELIVYARNETITVNTTRYGGFEQVGGLPQGFSRNDVQMTAAAGDIVLYSGDQLVLFFGSNSWSYTMLGHIKGLSENELSSLLDKSSAVVEMRLD